MKKNFMYFLLLLSVLCIGIGAFLLMDKSLIRVDDLYCYITMVVGGCILIGCLYRMLRDYCYGDANDYDTFDPRYPNYDEFDGAMPN